MNALSMSMGSSWHAVSMLYVWNWVQASTEDVRSIHGGCIGNLWRSYEAFMAAGTGFYRVTMGKSVFDTDGTGG
ncbi:hypothetical protein [Filimonas zeae]|uniref:hypothetical protein n=1 Tax=Filimonas zeae TaxID=1737353 RepID=UPI00286CCF3B|nr:hypothetical protein [Filimonas zeae]